MNPDPEQFSDMIEAAPYSVDELRRAVFEKEGSLGRPLAFGLLTRKDYPSKIADLERVLLNEQEVPRLRVMAANALAEEQDPEALQVLEKGLGTQQEATLRAVLKAMAKVGLPIHLRMLQDYSKRSDLVGREAQRALSLLAKRLNVDMSSKPGLGGTIPIERIDKTRVIEIGKPENENVSTAIDSISPERLTREGAVSMTCLGRTVIFLFEKESLARGLEMFRRSAEIGVVAEQQQVEGVGWELRYRVFVNPESQEVFQIMVTTHDGRPFLVGHGQVRDGEANYHLVAEDIPGTLPLLLRGRFDGERVLFDEARVALHRHPGKTPTPAT